MTDQDRLSGRHTFATDAERYAARRPTYPTALFDRVAEHGGLGRGARVLEVGPGTGQATRDLAARGWEVTAVELGAELAAVARRELADLPGVQVVTADVETWPLPDQPFDAVCCFTAWHWLSPATRLVRAAAALRPGGTLAVVWTHHVAGGTREFFTAAQGCYERFDPETSGDGPPREVADLSPADGELRDSPLVTDVSTSWHTVDLTYTTGAYLDLLRTYSTTIRLPPARQDALLGCLGELVDHRFGGSVTKRYAFELLLARTP